MRIYGSAYVNVHLQKSFRKCAFMEPIPYMCIYESTYVYVHLQKHFRICTFL